MRDKTRTAKMKSEQLAADKNQLQVECAELVKHKKIREEHTEKFKVKVALADTEAAVVAVEEHVERVTDAAAPITMTGSDELPGDAEDTEFRAGVRYLAPALFINK